MKYLVLAPIWVLTWLLAAVPKMFFSGFNPLSWVMVTLMVLTKNRPAILYWPWFNPEDELTYPKWYARKHPKLSHSVRLILYNAWRNPAAGLRKSRLYAPVPNKERIRFVGNIDGAHKPPGYEQWYWFLCWEGFRAGFYLTRWFKMWDGKLRWLDFRVGWKYSPSDAKADDANKLRHGVGYTFISPTFHE